MATTNRLADPPSVTVVLDGCVVMAGGGGTGVSLTLSVTGAEVTLPPAATIWSAFVAGQGQRKPDNERIDRLFTRDPSDLREILDDASSDEGREWSREAVRVIANGEADAAIADVKRQVSHR